ncbi:IDEAL domain-containing protein [Alicyclobacillus sp. ALC3]|uniref:IDEAL domain-containing protein n=1 Tax=Alicyclobacillus sp. ALC3 TaxID=2796143 RepID=UPI0023795576|nr:IDEAL domain-containing protein [Alicyclobacillus sp. ALC3]WDL97468.1 IDEAL domain-containing protein [Alicyclobacillus sp. ALC3]
MIAKEDILSLKAKILPSGADQILDFLAGRHHQVELTHIVLENVPLLIIGRHGMIARIPVGGVLQKVSQPAGILELLQTFFQKQETLYLFINLPELPVPAEVTRVLQEVQSRAQRKEELRKLIDRALDERDSALFYEASNEWRKLNLSDYSG